MLHTVGQPRGRLSQRRRHPDSNRGRQPIAMFDREPSADSTDRLVTAACRAGGDSSSTGPFRPLGRGSAPSAVRSDLPDRRQRTRPLLFILVTLGLMMASIDTTIVAVALPHLRRDLHVSLVAVGWTLTAYQLVQAMMMPLAGKISDSLGRKPVFLGCVGLFTIGSLLCGIAPSIWVLIAARVIQGIGGGALLPSAIGVIAEVFADVRAQAVGLVSTIMPIGGLLGPNLGGVILEYSSWRYLFFVNLPLGILVLLGVGLLFRERTRTESTPINIDGTGLVQYAGAMVLLLVPLSFAGSYPALWRTPVPYAAICASGALFVIFLRHIGRCRSPLLDYDLVARSPFVALNIFNVFVGVTVMGLSSFIPTYAVARFGMTALESGAVLTPRNLAMVGTAFVTSVFVIRRSYRFPMLLGVCSVAATLFLLGSGRTEMAFGDVRLGGFWLMATILLLNGIGLGMLFPAASNAALDLAPLRAAGITGVRGAFRQSGGVMSITAIAVGLTFFPTVGSGLAIIFRILAGVMLVIVVPLVFLIPDMASANSRRRLRKSPYSSDGS